MTMGYWDSPEMTKLLDDFKIELEQVRYNFKKNFQKEEACVLYHYTRRNNLEGILTGQCLWVTNIEYLNDTSEFSYGINLINDVLDQRYSDAKFKELIQAMIEKFRKRTKDFFILSLSKNPENLLLWTNYALTDGFSLGVDYSRISFLLEGISYDDKTEYIKTNFDLLDGNVIYSVDQQRQIINESLDRLYKIYEKYREVSDSDQFKIISGSIFFEVVHFITLFKDSCFSQEEEYRFVFEKGENLSTNVRQVNGRDIPYISLDFTLCEDYSKGIPVTEIGIGPKNDSCEGQLKSLANLNNYVDVSIFKSRIPLR